LLFLLDIILCDEGVYQILGITPDVF